MKKIGSIAFVLVFAAMCPVRAADNLKAFPPAESGAVRLVGDAPPEPPLFQGATLHLVDTAAPEPYDLGAFTLTEVEAQSLALEPAEPPSAEQLDVLLTSFGPWSLSRADPQGWPSHYADDLLAKERLPSESFLAIDPLVSISTAIAAVSPSRTSPMSTMSGSARRIDLSAVANRRPALRLT